MRTIVLSVLMGGVIFLGVLQAPTPVAAVSPLVPDLAMAPPGDFSVQHKPGGGRWLRFSTTIVNIGDGPFDIQGYDAGGNAIPGTSRLNVRQRIQNDDRTWSPHDIPATMFFAGDGHDHWHVEGLQLYELDFETPAADPIENGAKTGFCFWDTTDYYGTGNAGTYHPDRTNACQIVSDGTSEWVPMGLSVGWGDKYPATISGQYIDITGLPYGTYWLTVTADPSGEFIEKLEGNNVHRSKLQIERSSVTVLYQDPAPGTDSAAPNAPTGLTVEHGDEKVFLDWTDNPETDGVADYAVYRRVGDDPYALHATVSDSAYTDEKLANGTSYCYRVTATDSAGNESTASGEACATPATGSTSVTVHIGDLDGGSRSDGRYWTATVIVTVHDSNEKTVSNATVSGNWTGGDGSVSSCTTGSEGTCSVSSGSIPKSVAGVGFSVSSVSSAKDEYDSTKNHDVDATGDSNGTTIVVAKP